MKHTITNSSTCCLSKPKLFIAVVICSVIGTFYFACKHNLNDEETFVHNFTNKKIEKGEMYCNIPSLDPFGKDVKPFVNFTNLLTTLKCNKAKYPQLFEIEYSSSSTLIRTKIKQKIYNLRECCYKLITRNHTNKIPDTTVLYSQECHKIKKNKMRIHKNHELIAIFCNKAKEKAKKNKKKNSPVLVDMFALTPIKEKVESRVLKIEHSRKFRKGFKADRLNLLVLGLDSMSHMNLKRTMPKVVKYMVQTRRAIGMLSHTRVGDNTFPNMMAVLTSLSEKEIYKTCEKNMFFDKCNFLWNFAESQGYRTSFGEDASLYNLKNGFRKQPTDYYLRPLTREALKKIENGPEKLCFGPRYKLDFLLNNAKAMHATMGKARKYFQLLWSTGLTHSHGCFNCGIAGDQKLLDFFNWFQKARGFENTVVVLMSDHGVRYGKFRKTWQGKIEENQPFIYFMFPEKFMDKNKLAMENLKKNEKRLTTHFDTYETFKDILQVGNLQDDQIKKRMDNLEQQINIKFPRGISMFLPIPIERTCETAQIKEAYCTCRNSEPVSLKSVDVRQAANYAVFKLNYDLVKYPKCAILGLESVQKATLVIPKNVTTLTKSGKIYQVDFTTIPGKATFSATLLLNSKNEFTLSGAISRTSMYKNESFCVDDSLMKKFCYCRVFLVK